MECVTWQHVYLICTCCSNGTDVAVVHDVGMSRSEFAFAIGALKIHKFRILLARLTASLTATHFPDKCISCASGQRNKCSYKLKISFAKLYFTVLKNWWLGQQRTTQTKDKMYIRTWGNKRSYKNVSVLVDVQSILFYFWLALCSTSHHDFWNLNLNCGFEHPVDTWI